MMIKIRFCGFGGQGIVLLAEILGHAAVFAGKWAAQSASYGAEARGSASTSEVIISEEWIPYPKVEEADILVAMSQDGYNKYLKEVVEGGTILFDSTLVRPDGDGDGDGKGNAPKRHHRYPIPASRLAREELESPIVANMIMLGALIRLTGVVSPEETRGAIEAHVAERFRELDLRALEVGLRLAEELKERDE
ncbi:TPA: hypothetical protein EYP12_06345 [Candidatus Bipolaricaulota bacterium]|nr:hypothetical protein [Candidatus Bipolaricaulota bacterium]